MTNNSYPFLFQNEFDYYKNHNNPSKEILASSGIWDEKPYAPFPYADDIPKSLIANTGINTTTTTTTSTTPNVISTSGSEPILGVLSSGTFSIDDMLVFNNYIHYDVNNTLRSFNTQTFLEQAITTFNVFTGVTGR